MIQILLRLGEELVVQDLRLRQIRFEGLRVVDQVVDCTVDFHACSRVLQATSGRKY
jgi:hypothetical protein